MATLHAPKPPTWQEKMLTEAVSFINLYFLHMAFHANPMLMEDQKTMIISVQTNGTLDEASQADLKAKLQELVSPISLSIYFVDQDKYR